jgi:DNA-binding MarR family transcriptional regulator
MAAGQRARSTDLLDREDEQAASPRPVASPDSSWDAATTRGHERERMRAIEHREPLQRRILHGLKRNPSTPSELAVAVGAALPSVSRQLRRLRDGGLVEIHGDEADGRLRLYKLTPEGAVRLAEHDAFGAPVAPPEPLSEEANLRYLRSGLRNAVKQRRQGRRLDDVAEQLSAIREEASIRGAHDIAIEASASLATTRSEQRNLPELRRVLDELRHTALGLHPSGDPKLALPAAAFHEHALGHMPEMADGPDLNAKARHLDAAQTLFGQLRASYPESASDWKRREAWSVLSLARNLRKRSRLEEAVAKTGYAIGLFDELEDPYGRARCLFMLGFCSRLMGDFASASALLDAAYELASANAFRRLEAELLMQRGEVHRCEGDNARARQMIEESLELADQMELIVTRAFAQSALGALACQEHRPDDALLALDEAARQFSAYGDSEGLALNARRQAVVERRLANQGSAKHLKAARDLVQTALERYQGLGSPAGISALEVEQARLTILRGGQGKIQIANLLARLDDARERYLLELDPWVPTVLRAFAAEVGNRRLRERAAQLTNASEDRIAAWAKQDIAQSVGVSMARPSRHRHPAVPSGADAEMAGEPRGQLDEQRVSLRG